MRLRDDTAHPRPLLDVPNPGERIVELLQQRERGYKRFPQIMTNGQEPKEIAANLLDLIREDVKRIPINYPGGAYDYMVGVGLLPFIRKLAEVEGMLVVITDENVGELYAPSCGDVDHVMTIPMGKQHKTLATVEMIHSQLLEMKFDQTGTIVALGGTVIGDIAGFVAATYMRGVNFVQCPTTLLAMVDTSIGRQVGIDLPQGENQAGYLKQPTAVIADIATLQTLSKEEFSSDMSEIIKRGLLADTDLLKKIETDNWPYTSDVGHTLFPDLQLLIAQAIQVKMTGVQENPFA